MTFTPGDPKKGANAARDEFDASLAQPGAAVALSIDRSFVARACARRVAVGALVAFLTTFAAAAFAAGHSLRFNGAGAGDIDRVKIRVDDPLTAIPGPPADVGAGDFTIEFWLM